MPLEAFELPYVQRGLVAVLLLAVAAGLLGTWIVLRGLAFFSHAVGTAAFPGLVLADGLGFAPALGALGAALLVAAAVTRLGGGDSATALVLVAALAAGVVLASDVFGTQGGVDGLLFGSLLAVGGGDLVVAGLAGLAVAAATALAGPRWLAAAFDPAGARAAGLRSRAPDVLLLGLVAVVAVATLTLVGALLAGALIVVPAATTRLLVERVPRWQVATVLLAASEGVLGLWLAVQLNAPPGATIAVVAGACFALACLWRARRRAALAGAAALVAAGCGATAPADDRPVVVATTPQVADLARHVGGQRVRVVQLLRQGADPHDYEPRPDDVSAVADARVVLASGLGLDPWVDEVLRGAGGDARVVRVGDRVPVKLRGESTDLGRPHEGQVAHGEPTGPVDPHWWHEPRNLRAAAEVVARAVGGRADAYLREVDATADAVRACLRRIPQRDRVLVTDHDAFAYFANAYGLEVVGTVIPSSSSQAQASAGALADLARTVRARGVLAVFPEAGLNADLARALAERAGVRVGPALLADTLGPPGPRTLLEAARANAAAVAQGLTGSAGSCGR